LHEPNSMGHRFTHDDRNERRLFLSSSSLRPLCPRPPELPTPPRKSLRPNPMTTRDFGDRRASVHFPQTLLVELSTLPVRHEATLPPIMLARKRAIAGRLRWGRAPVVVSCQASGRSTAARRSTAWT